MFKSKLSKVIVSLLRRIAGVTRSGAKRLMRAMLQALMAMGRRAKLPVAGFVLPTVTMVLLVVILLTVAIVLRSFDRANLARNVRVNQQVLAAATPALDRAKAKIEYMLREDPQRPTSTPSDAEMYRIMSAYDATNDFYKFGDEQRVVLKFPLSPGATATTPTVNAGNPQGPLINTTGQENEAINTAWRYAVDTDSDGKFDTFTLYGIFFRSPPLAANGSFSRARKPLDSRTPPMSLGGLANTNCIQGIDTVASLVGDSGWYRVDGKLQKSFFVYTANVPITPNDIQKNGLGGDYEAFTGTPSISALEYQQDQSRIPLSNNAVVYEDDLDISPGPALNLNGRVFTNSNLLVGGVRDANSIVTLYQVSSKNSCFYEQENSKVVVGGNAVNSSVSSLTPLPVTVHLFKSTSDPDQPNTGAPQMSRNNDSVGADTALDVLYDSDAYTRRLDALVAGQLLAAETTDPVSVQRARLAPLNQSRNDALETYFKERLRKVPFKESLALTNPGGIDPTQPPSIYVEGSLDTVRPRDLNWSLPTAGSATEGRANGLTGLDLVLDQPPANNPDNVKPAANEPALGNRFQIGNNLPAQRWDGSKFLGLNAKQYVNSGNTPTWADGGRRFRTPEVTKLADVGATDRGNGWGEAPNPASPFKDGFWERTAAQIPTSPLDGTGGLRVITSAGVYDRTNSFLPPPKWIDSATGAWKSGPASATVSPPPANTYDDPTTGATEQYPVVWPDSMPMSPLGLGSQVYNNTAATNNWIPWPATLPDATDLPRIQPNPSFVDESRVTTARKFAKGDLRMRATAVYHHANNGFDPIALPAGAQPDQTPLACVSSYYDPSNASTARNITGLADVSGEGAVAPDANRRVPARGAQQAVIGSNNGITYGPPTGGRPGGRSTPDPATGLLSGGDPILDAQANLVFPDGRFANGPLRTALQSPESERTLAQKAAIDSTNCALQILDGSITPVNAASTTFFQPIPNGAIQEVAFLNAKEIKASERDNPNTIVNEAFTLSRPLTDPVQTTNYNLPLEEREPLEIRATQLDINALRGQTIGTGEWLLPNSGIIYASRDDALPDRSDRTLNPTTGEIDAARSKRISPNDYQLDPTRKPNGIVLINGNSLFRGTGNTPASANGSVVNVVREKGLTLVSNLPAYIQGTFNPHGQIAAGTTTFNEIEEFNEVVDPTNWSNFYRRGQSDPVTRDLNRNFACRQGDPRLPQCQGDYWRPANVLADAVTLLSQNFRFGFRNEGDFDLRNNAGAAAVLPRRQQGFFNNNFVTNGLSSGAFTIDGNLAGTGAALTDATYVTPNPPLVSSYFNNFVTPVQRRGNFAEYLMEVCTKLPVSECTDTDWVVDATPGAQRTARVVRDGGTTTYVSPNPANPAASPFQAGSTADPPLPALQRFPRRIAYNRDTNNQLPDATNPQPLGIGVGGAPGAIGPGVGTSQANSLWFAVGNPVVFNNSATPHQLNTNNNAAGTIDGSQVPLPTVAAQSTALTALATTPVTLPTTTYTYSGSQPLLAPVQQLVNPAPGSTNVQDTGWMPRAFNTTFNLIVAAGDTPSRTLTTSTGTANDFNGGLQNLPRFLEIWSSDSLGFSLSTNIKGSFIQQNRSAFSTAPYRPIHVGGYPVNTVDRLATVFSRSSAPTTARTPISTTNFAPLYNIQGGGRIPYFTPPTRNWGYDVGLLSQPPDLFTQKFTTPSTKTQPAEYFREVPRNDEWVNTLMCGVVAPNQPNAGQNATEIRTNCPT
jgi:hypothetical protein